MGVDHSARSGGIIGSEWSGGAMALGKLQVPGRPTNFDSSRARAYCAYSRCGWGLFGHFYSIISLFFLPLPGRWPLKVYRIIKIDLQYLSYG